METIELMSDFGCPFCYKQHLALSQLRREGVEFTIRPLPYMLRPQTPMEGRLFTKEEIAAFTPGMEELKRDPLFRDVSFCPLKATYQTYPAHLFSYGAMKAGRYLDFALAVYHAYFGEGKNISEERILLDLCEKIGLDGEKIKNSPSADDMRQGIYRGFQLRKEFSQTTVPAMYLVEKKRFLNSSKTPEELREELQ